MKQKIGPIYWVRDGAKNVLLWWFGILGSSRALTQVYTIMAIKLRVEAQQDKRAAGLDLMIGV